MQCGQAPHGMDKGPESRESSKPVGSKTDRSQYEWKQEQLGSWPKNLQRSTQVFLSNTRKTLKLGDNMFYLTLK